MESSFSSSAISQMVIRSSHSLHMDWNLSRLRSSVFVRMTAFCERAGSSQKPGASAMACRRSSSSSRLCGTKAARSSSSFGFRSFSLLLYSSNSIMTVFSSFGISYIV